MIEEDKIVERKLLLKHVFSLSDLYEMGKKMGVPYFQSFISCWDIEEDDAALEIARNVSEKQLLEAGEIYASRKWTVFRGKYYTFENGVLRLKGSWEKIRTNISEVKKKFGDDSVALLKIMVDVGGVFGLNEYRRVLKQGVAPYPILEKLERLRIIITSYKGKDYQEWKILEETLPLIRLEVGLRPSEISISANLLAETKDEKEDYVFGERRKVEEMDNELTVFLADLLKKRMRSTIEFGKTFLVQNLANYLQELFGKVLYFDSFLSIIQQYGLANAEIVNPRGKTGMGTGWSLALFGEPGTGKSFASRDMILGGGGGRIKPHGIPGRNRYCGGITPARFIRIGQAYAGRIFNFIVPEFNDWFRYSGMVDVLKIAMERGEIKYELHNEVVGPYRFDSFFSVNYNTQVLGRGYEVTISDPNFNAIEDRLTVRMHRLTKERFVEIAQSQVRLSLGEMDVEKEAPNIRDHLTLVYAIETGHPLVRERFPYKPVMITNEMFETIKKARELILDQIPQDSLRFSARLESNVIRFACAASLLNYFQTDLDYIPVNEDALNYAIKLYFEEASVRSQEEFRPEQLIEMMFG